MIKDEFESLVGAQRMFLWRLMTHWTEDIINDKELLVGLQKLHTCLMRIGERINEKNSDIHGK